VNVFKSFNPERAILPNVDVDWKKVVDFLKQNGVDKGTLLILHSSPMEIISSLLNLIGAEGTLAMPVIRSYKEEPETKEWQNFDYSSIICTYDTQRSEIWTGALPKAIIKQKDAVISRHPLNSMAAVGRLAGLMMENNIKDEYSTPCGKNSSWAFCVENNAIVVGLGIYLSRSLTVRLVSEDLYMDEWPIKNWWRKRVFDVIDGNFKKRINVLERDYKWGCFYLAEVNFRRDLIENNILISRNVGGINVEIISAKKLLEFVRSRKNKCYPYCIPNKYFNK
jgi:aminoglycoside 3-N-acetyltransferase